MTKVIVTLLVLVGAAVAQEPTTTWACSATEQQCLVYTIPDAPSYTRASQPSRPGNVWLSPFRDPSFYAGTAAHVAGVGVDVHFVQGCERTGACIEGNPGADKWKNRIPEIALGTLGRYGCSLMLHDHKWWRMACLAPSIAIAAYDIIDGTKIHYEGR